ncbi:capsule assembly Wzi family protein [Pedobacter sp. MR22-3]|uniref:capsule assembly Wzi family protein n=1 Tax=Pedobacter sp. MR22-3 TaxID=2994552 RepID=UPI00224520D8|nr:capsule assembly Wzi family protein [Pedobacter sp. MR22-3]
MTMRIFYPFLLLIFLSSWVSAQTLPVGLLENVEDAYRRQQLLGKDSSNTSYMIRPMFMSDRNDLSLDPDSSYSLLHFRKLLYSNPKFKTQIYALPLAWQQQVNSHHPYGMNDGSMVQAKGYETQISAGIYAKIGPLSIQLRPEYVYAQNLKFQRLADAPNGVYWNTPVTGFFYNRIDLPDRMGNKPYSKLSLGQSSIRLNVGPVSAGFSNENLWWGPGVKNSLLMSNNASGFRHVTLNTTRPVKTYIGSFEAQIIGGRLEQSGFTLNRDPTVPQAIRNELFQKPYEWRYISGMVLTYQPKWVPGLYLGFDRTFVVNRSKMGNKFGDYFPIFSQVEKVGYVTPEGTYSEDAAERDQYISFFTKYVFTESKAEVYFQFGRNDHSYDLRDALAEPEHTRAYVVGMRKLIPLKRADEFIQVGVELTQLERSATTQLRDYPTWYIHGQVLDGYTNQGQVLGAGIGPGSNLQTLDVSWVKGLKRIGLQLERKVNDNDLFYEFAFASGDKRQYINRHWIDLAIGSTFSWNFKRFVANAQLTYIRSLNYQYQWQDSTPPGDYWNWNKQDVNNVHAKIGIVYLFN